MIPGDIPQPIVLFWLFVFGAVVGSFLNVCIYRIPQHDRLWDQLSGLNHPPSTCPFCKKRILAIDNIPIFGWLWLRGRCRFCRHSIPVRYALIEFFNGLLWVALYIAIVPAGFQAKVETSSLYSTLGALGQPGIGYPGLIWLVNAEYVYYLILAEALLVATFIDFDLMIIPDGVTVPGTILGLLGGTILGTPTLWPVWFFAQRELNGLQTVLPDSLQWMLTIPEQIVWFNSHPHWHGFVNSLLGMLVGAGTVLMVRIMGSWAFGREAMGLGDVTLMAMIGSFIGWQPSLIVFFMLAPLTALAAVAITFSLRFNREIPFGPYLSAGALLIVFLWRSYFSGLDVFFGRGPFLLIIFALMGMIFFPLLVLIRAIKQWLGFKDDFADGGYEEGEWTSGDQLAFYANKDERMTQESLTPKAWWPGTSVGQATSYTNQWRGSR